MGPLGPLAPGDRPAAGTRNEHLSSYQYYWDAVIEHLPGEAERM